MNEKELICELYVEKNLSPIGSNLYFYNERSAVNAVTIVTEQPWESSVKSLIEQVHFRCNMPSYKTCITDLFRANGFILDNCSGRLSELLHKFNHFGEDRKYIIKLPHGYFAVIKDPKTDKYVFEGFWPQKYPFCEFFVDEVWVYFPGTDNRTGIKRDSKERKAKEGNSRLNVKNMNPSNKNTTDCVIRGLSAAYGCTWHEAVDYIAESIRYSDPVLNVSPNIQQALITLGFERHSEIKRNKKPLSGKQFCELMEHTYFKGERIFAYVGNHHCAAIVPELQDDGSTTYVIQDTWDSTNRYIHEYFVYKEKKNAPQQSEERASFKIALGEQLKHPLYGIGTIIDIKDNVKDRIICVEFEGSEIKKISENWLLTKTQKRPDDKPSKKENDNRMCRKHII